jgi:hypothetical protein
MRGQPGPKAECVQGVKSVVSESEPDVTKSKTSPTLYDPVTICDRDEHEIVGNADDFSDGLLYGDSAALPNPPGEHSDSFTQLRLPDHTQDVPVESSDPSTSGYMQLDQLPMILPHVLQAARSTLTIAWTQYEAVKEQRAQCAMLLQRCTDLLLAVAKPSNFGLNDPMHLVHVRSLEKCVFCKKTRFMFKCL